MELAKVINTGNKPITLRHDIHGDVTIQPRKERIVSIDHITVNLGNPGARNEGKNRVRDADYAALKTRWGFYEGIFPSDAWENQTVDPTSGDLIGPFKPQVEVYDLEDERIYTILDDPTGELGAGREFTLSPEQQDSKLLNKRIEQLESQLAQVLAVAGQMQAAQLAVPVPATTGEPVVVDPAVTPAPTTDNPPVETQEARNEQRDELPTPRPAEPKKDKPATTRVGPK